MLQIGKIFKKKKLDFDIFGSCVSRDIFEYEEAQELLCKEYIARQSVVSALSDPISIDETELATLTSNFQKKLVLNDFKKTTFQKLKDSSSNYLVVDFIDERFRLVELGESYLTQSAELITSKYLENKTYTLVDKRKWDKAILCANVEAFADKISGIYKKGHIFIHKAKMMDKYIGKDQEIHSFSKTIIKDNSETNSMLEVMYECLEKELDKPYTIDISDKYYADENHKWGLAVMHYQKEYYQEVALKIKTMCMK